MASETFANRTLPSRLKVQILSYNLTFDGHLSASAFRRRGKPQKSRDRLSDDRRTVEEMVVTSFAVPYIAGLVTDVFYSKNKFNIPISDNQIFYPPHLVNTYIRHIYLNISPKIGSWELLRNLANGDYGFQHLREICIYSSFLHRRTRDSTKLERFRTYLKALEIVELKATVLTLRVFAFGTDDEERDLQDSITRNIFRKVKLMENESGKTPKEEWQDSGMRGQDSFEASDFWRDVTRTLTT